MRAEIEDLVKNLDGDTTCPHVQVIETNFFLWKWNFVLLCSTLSLYLIYGWSFSTTDFFCQDLLSASDREGGVDLPHFMLLWQKFKESVSEDGDDTEEEIKKAFKDYDVNGDGYITKDEMMNVSWSLTDYRLILMTLL